jgi:hypothetical protein
MDLTVRQADILRWLLKNPTNNSTNAVYVNTSESCLRRGLTRSMGSNWLHWTTPKTMVALGLVDITVTTRARVRGRGRGTRRAWHLTTLGLDVASKL